MFKQLEGQLKNAIELMTWVDCTSERLHCSDRPYIVKIKVM